MTNSKREISVTDGSVGPRHDPYGETTIRVVVGEKEGVHYSNGLGQFRVTLKTAGEIVREECFYTGMDAKRDLANETKAVIWFRRHVGITPDDAVGEYYAIPDGPEIYM